MEKLEVETKTTRRLVMEPTHVREALRYFLRERHGIIPPFDADMKFDMFSENMVEIVWSEAAEG